MPRRLAASLSLLVFAVCLIVGIQSQNPLTTVLSRALLAMAGTMVISLIIGTMAQRMLEESMAKREQELREELAAAAAENAAEATAVGAAGNSAAGMLAGANNSVGKQGRAGR